MADQPDDTKKSDEAPRKLRRRRVLRWLGVTVAVGTMGAGSYALYEAYSRGMILRSDDGPDRDIPDRRVPVDASQPKMVIARGEAPDANVAAALERIGGMARFVEKGDVVVVKPNIGFKRSPLHAATTNPEVVAAVVRACRDAGAARVQVVDCPAHNASAAFEQSGIAKAAAEAGAEVIMPNDTEYVNAELPGFGRWLVLEPFATATKIINVPATKHHASATVTAGMKNWFGVLGGMRNRLHDGLDDAIVELAALMQPTLTIVDATRMLMRNGPSGGNLADVKRADAIAIGQDPVALDAWAAAMLEADPAKLGWLQKAAARGLGTADYRSLDPIEITTA